MRKHVIALTAASLMSVTAAVADYPEKARFFHRSVASR